MIDTLVACRDRFEQVSLEHLGVRSREYGVLTLHRPSNVDDPATLKGLMGAIEQIQRELPLIFPVHPRTRKAMASYSASLPNVQLVEPMGYLEFMKLIAHARFVMTDSGGVQEETTYLGVPCLTLRSNTERPSTVEQGTNRLIGSAPERILDATWKVLHNGVVQGRVPELWDGKASGRILDVVD
jgi:UDP-N-acetylglucosamine 2-epimerase (non-hydrolysing)